VSGNRDMNIGSEQDDALAPSFLEQCDSDEEVFIGLDSSGKFKNSSRTKFSSWSTAAYSISWIASGIVGPGEGFTSCHPAAV